MDIRSPRSLTKTLTHFSIAKWTDESDDDLVEIDLTDVEFIDTAGLVLMSSIAERAMHDRTLVRFTPPADPNVARYASRMHLGTCLAQLGVDAHLPAVNEFDTGARLAELRQVTPATTDELADYVHAAILDNGGSASDAKDFYLAVSEVLSNVVDHSGADGGWAAMQVMPQPGPTPPQITFAVADVGMGLRRSLLKTHTVHDDLVALDLAFQEGVSGTGDTRGMGLSDLYGRVNRRSGIVRVWSGLASGSSRRNAAIKCQSLTVGFPGTMIYAALKPQSDEKVIR